MPGGRDPFSVSTGLTDCHEEHYLVRDGYLFGVGLLFGLFVFGLLFFFLVGLVWFGWFWFVFVLPGEW